MSGIWKTPDGVLERADTLMEGLEPVHSIEMEDGPFYVVAGEVNPTWLVGPFDKSEEASGWAARRMSGEVWQILSVTRPEEFPFEDANPDEPADDPQPMFPPFEGPAI